MPPGQPDSCYAGAEPSTTQNAAVAAEDGFDPVRMLAALHDASLQGDE